MGDGVTAWNDLPYAIPIYLSPDDIVQDATTDSSVKVPSASVTKNLQDQVTALNNSLSELIKHVDITIDTGDNVPVNDSRAYDFTTQLAGKTILSAVLQTTVVGALAFKIDYGGKRVVFSNVSNTTVKISDRTVIRFYYLNI